MESHESHKSRERDLEDRAEIAAARLGPDTAEAVEILRDHLRAWLIFDNTLRSPLPPPARAGGRTARPARRPSPSGPLTGRRREQ
jgi:hypothetical protein